MLTFLSSSRTVLCVAQPSPVDPPSAISIGLDTLPSRTYKCKLEKCSRILEKGLLDVRAKGVVQRVADE